MQERSFEGTWNLPLHVPANQVVLGIQAAESGVDNHPAVEFQVAFLIIGTGDVIKKLAARGGDAMRRERESAGA